MPRAAKIIIFFIVFAILAVIFIILYVPNIYFCHKSKELRFLSITPEPYPFSESAVPEDYKRTDLNGVSFMAPAKLDEGGKDNWKSLRSESGDFEVRVCSPNNFKENAYDFDIRLVKGEVPDNLYKRTTAAVNLTYDDVKPLIPYNAFFFYHLAVKKEKTAYSYLGGGYTISISFQTTSMTAMSFTERFQTKLLPSRITMLLLIFIQRNQIIKPNRSCISAHPTKKHSQVFLNHSKLSNKEKK